MKLIKSLFMLAVFLTAQVFAVEVFAAGSTPLYVSAACEQSSGSGISWTDPMCNINDAINEINQRTRSGSTTTREGGVIYLSPGVFSVSAATEILSPTRLVGAGVGLTTIRGNILVRNDDNEFNGDSNDTDTITGYGSFTSISNMTVNGSIELNGTEFGEVDNVVIINDGNTPAIKVWEAPESDTYGDWNHIVNTSVSSSGSSAIDRGENAGIFASNDTFTASGVSAISGGGTGGINITASRNDDGYVMDITCPADELGCSTSDLYANSKTVSNGQEGAKAQINNAAHGNAWVNHYFLSTKPSDGYCGMEHTSFYTRNGVRYSSSYRLAGPEVDAKEDNGSFQSSIYAIYNIPLRYDIARLTWLADAAYEESKMDCVKRDTDGDDQADANDDNDDNDSEYDVDDNCSLAWNSGQENFDGDDYGDVCDVDDDNDGIWDSLDPDDDNDGVVDASDAFPLNASASVDTDNDGMPDVCINNTCVGNLIVDADDDGDGVADAGDNCSLVGNANQLNTDGDAQGDACDSDDDNDYLADIDDNCALIANADQLNTDADAQGDACDSDDDNDLFADVDDNCSLIANADQLNADGDTEGDVCDANDDNDCYLDVSDPTPLLVSSPTTKAGDLDCNFVRGSGSTNGLLNGGIAKTAISSGGDQVSGMTKQSDGKLVVVGYATINGTNKDFAVVRYNTDGSMDTTFCQAAGNCTGKVITPFDKSGSTLDDRAFAVIQQSDGKLVVVGYADQSSTTTPNLDIAIVRYNTSGAIDTSFGSGGKLTTKILTTEIGSNADMARAVYQQADGKLVIAGYTCVEGTAPSCTNKDIAVVRYNVNGTLDSSFDADGKLTTKMGISEVGSKGDVANALITTTRSLAISTNTTASPSVFTVTPAHGYAVNVPIKFTGTMPTTTPQLVAGTTYYVNTVPSTTTFTVKTAVSGGSVVQASTVGSGMAVTDERIVVAGNTCVAGTAPTCTNVDIALVRYIATGQLDTTFGVSGKVTTKMQAIESGTLSDVANAIAVQSDGKLVVAGTTNTSTGGDDFAVLRYTTAGALDTTFNSSGKLTQSIGNGDADDGAYKVAIRSNGKILVAGSSNNGTNDDVALIRLTSGGILDATFNVTGKVTTAIGSGNDYGRSLLIDANDNIVAAGYYDNAGNDDFFVLRYFGRTAN